MCTDKDEGPRRRSSVEWVRDCASVTIFGIRFRYYGLAEDKRAKGVGWQGPLNNQRQRGERSVGRSTRLKFSYLVTHRCIRLEEVVKSFINRRSFRLGGPEQERRQTHGGAGRKRMRKMWDGGTLPITHNKRRREGASRQKGCVHLAHNAFT